MDDCKVLKLYSDKYAVQQPQQEREARYGGNKKRKDL